MVRTRGIARTPPPRTMQLRSRTRATSVASETSADGGSESSKYTSASSNFAAGLTELGGLEDQITAIRVQDARRDIHTSTGGQGTPSNTSVQDMDVDVTPRPRKFRRSAPPAADEDDESGIDSGMEHAGSQRSLSNAGDLASSNPWYHKMDPFAVNPAARSAATQTGRRQHAVVMPSSSSIPLPVFPRPSDHAIQASMSISPMEISSPTQSPLREQAEPAPLSSTPPFQQHQAEHRQSPRREQARPAPSSSPFQQQRAEHRPSPCREQARPAPSSLPFQQQRAEYRSSPMQSPRQEQAEPGPSTSRPHFQQHRAGYGTPPTSRNSPPAEQGSLYNDHTYGDDLEEDSKSLDDNQPRYADDDDEEAFHRPTRRPHTSPRRTPSAPSFDERSFPPSDHGDDLQPVSSLRGIRPRSSNIQRSIDHGYRFSSAHGQPVITASRTVRDSSPRNPTPGPSRGAGAQHLLHPGTPLPSVARLRGEHLTGADFPLLGRPPPPAVAERESPMDIDGEEVPHQHRQCATLDDLERHVASIQQAAQHHYRSLKASVEVRGRAGRRANSALPTPRHLLPIKRTGFRTPRGVSHNQIFDRVRCHFARLLGPSLQNHVTRAELDEYTNAWEVDNGQTCEPATDPSRFRLDLEGTPHSHWNRSAIRVFTNDYIDYYNYEWTEELYDDIETKAFTRLKSLLRTYRTSMKTSAFRRAMERRCRRSLRKRTTFEQRLIGAITAHCPPEHIDMLQRMGPDGMSSDESDYETHAANPAARTRRPRYRVLRPKWRQNGEMTTWLRLFHSLYHIYRYKKGDLRGAWPRTRLDNPSNPSYSDSVQYVRRLPINAYEQGWLDSRNDLDYYIRPEPVPFVFQHHPDIIEFIRGTEEEMRRMDAELGWN